MKKIIVILFLISIKLHAQEFLVEKVSGSVLALKGISEDWIDVQSGQKLNGDDLLVTGEKSYVQLNKDGNRFILQSSSALGLNNIKKVSINDLLLALAMEEIRRVPKNGKKGNAQNTAVYGEEIKTGSVVEVVKNDLGFRKLNGAKQLAENGYKESAIIVAKETFRKHPDTKNNIGKRIFFVDVLIGLNLFEEAFDELNQLKNLKISSREEKSISNKIEEVKTKLANN